MIKKAVRLYKMSKVGENIIAIAIDGRAITLERERSKKKQRTDTKKVAKRIKSDNNTRSNREKSSIWNTPFYGSSVFYGTKSGYKFVNF